MERAYLRLAGGGGRLFADPQPAADESSFQVDNTSSQYYNSPYYTLHKNDLQPVPVPRVPEPRLDLHDLVGTDVTGPIEAAKVISFHAVGDTGAAKVSSFQSAAEATAHEASVADALARDVCERCQHLLDRALLVRVPVEFAHERAAVLMAEVQRDHAIG